MKKGKKRTFFFRNYSFIHRLRTTYLRFPRPNPTAYMASVVARRRRVWTCRLHLQKSILYAVWPLFHFAYSSMIEVLLSAFFRFRLLDSSEFCPNSPNHQVRDSFLRLCKNFKFLFWRIFNTYDRTRLIDFIHDITEIRVTKNYYY